MDDVLELLANYGPMTASELALELKYSLGHVQAMLASSSLVSCDGFGSYGLLEKE